MAKELKLVRFGVINKKERDNMDFNFKKKYGQNWLVDHNVLNRIIDSVNPTENDLIIEIGSGSGTLTKELQTFNSKILAYEIDLDTKVYLDKLNNDKITIIYDDFLKRDIKKDLEDYNYDNLYIIANLPYYITTPIIEKIIKEKLKPTEMVLMVQKEVAARLSAKPKTKDYGFITVYLNYYFNINKLFDVSKNAFKPVPNVDSAIIKLTSHNLYKCDEEKFIKLIKDSFTHKRKTLNNNLNNYDKELINKILNKHDLSLQSRAEEVPIEVFIEIVNKI